MTIIRCNNCFTHYEEDEINITDCNDCKTDKYLMQLDEESQLEIALNNKIIKWGF